MSDDEKQAIRQQRREAYREAKDDLAHREQQIKGWAEGFESIAAALRTATPERMVFAGDASHLVPGDHPIRLHDIPTKARLKESTAFLADLRSRVSGLEADLRQLGEWPI